MAQEHTGSGVRTVFLHIGTMKTGTTYLQSRLKEHRRALARDGVLAPGGQLAALRDLFSRPGTLGHSNVVGSWQQLVEKLQTSDCVVGVLSMEFLSTCTPPEIEAVLAELAPADVRVIVTVRDLARVMAAQWQETIHNRAVWTWRDYADEVVAQLGGGVSPSPSGTAAEDTASHAATRSRLLSVDEPIGDDAYPDHPSGERPTGTDADWRTVRRTAAGRFWRQHDIARIVRDWAAAVGVDRVQLVTVPPAGQPPELLWERFTDTIGVDADQYPRRQETVRSNTGVDLAAAEFLRRLNVRFDPQISRAVYLRHVRHLLGKSALVDRGEGLRPTLTSQQHARVVEHSERLVAHLRDLGVGVVGSLADLVPAPWVAPPPLAAGRLEEQVTEAAIDGLLAVLRQLDELEPVIAAAQDAEHAADDAGRQRRAQRRQNRDAAKDRSSAPGRAADTAES